MSSKMKKVMKDLGYFPDTIKLICRYDKKHFFIVIVLCLIIGIVPSVSLLLSQQMINGISAGKNLTIVFIYLVFYVLVSLLSEYLGCFKNYTETYLQNNVNYGLNCMVMEKCKKLSLMDFENSVTYDKLQRIQSEISFKPYQMLQLILGIISTAATLISSITILILWKPWCAVFLIIIPVLSSLYYINLGRTEFEYKLERTSSGRRSWYISRLLTTDSSIKEVKIFKLSDYLIDEYKKINKRFIKQDVDYTKKHSIFDVIHETILHFCSCIVVVFAIISAYSKEIMIGNVVTYIRSISMVESCCTSLLSNIYSLYSNSLYLKELFEFFELPESVEEKRCESKKIDCIEEISFKNVGFKYRQGKIALRNINLSMKRGEKIAVVGLNGAGKTTLIKLLTCLYPVQDGEIRINNQNISDFSATEIRNNISVLFQDYVKYEMSLRNNVGFGDVNKINDNDELNNAISHVGLQGMFPNGLDTQLGLWFNEGIGLSGGQWQRIAIARMMVKKSSVYILDEPNAALDPIAFNKILKEFFEYAKDDLCIFITHKMSSVHYADRIILMKDGYIIGDGNHEALYRDNEYYKELYDKEMNNN
ncbi:MAG: ABC transporter ATP-binding protein/permease [Lachnospiraceae bacterium]|nr:ABC transporter ATP-binding protein/permease [Lachnospiraceae bacterium]